MTVQNKVAIAALQSKSAGVPGQVVFVLYVTLENLGRDKLHYTPSHFRATDSAGFEYNVYQAPPVPWLEAGDLAPGEKISGNIAFDFPRSAKDIVVSYAPSSVLGGSVLQVAIGDARTP